MSGLRQRWSRYVGTRRLTHSRLAARRSAGWRSIGGLLNALLLVAAIVVVLLAFGLARDAAVEARDNVSFTELWIERGAGDAAGNVAVGVRSHEADLVTFALRVTRDGVPIIDERALHLRSEDTWSVSVPAAERAGVVAVLTRPGDTAPYRWVRLRPR